MTITTQTVFSDRFSTGFRRLVKGGFRSLGLDVRLHRSLRSMSLEVRRTNERGHQDIGLPVVCNDPLEALHNEWGGKPSAFACPIDQCVHVNGLNFAPNGWHPYTALLNDYQQGRADGYEGSVLERYYHQWQPGDAHDALIGLPRRSSGLSGLPGHLMYLFPWQARTVEEADAAVKAWCHGDNLEHGSGELTIDEHGFKDHGPMHPAAGRLEFDRLTEIFEILRRDGFDRRKGDVRVLMLKRGSDYRFLNFGGGLHRTASLAALRHRTVPARFTRPVIFDIADLEYWPQIRNGVWDREAAMAWFDHLFDFDARAWAREHAIID